MNKIFISSHFSGRFLQNFLPFVRKKRKNNTFEVIQKNISHFPPTKMIFLAKKKQMNFHYEINIKKKKRPRNHVMQHWENKCIDDCKKKKIIIMIIHLSFPEKKQRKVHPRSIVHIIHIIIYPIFQIRTDLGPLHSGNDCYKTIMYSKTFFFRAKFPSNFFYIFFFF